MAKTYLLSFVLVFALSCSKHTLPTQEPTQTETQVGESPLASPTPLALPTPTPTSPTPVPSSTPSPSPSPSATPTPTTSPSPTPVPVGSALLDLQPSNFDFGSVKTDTTATKTFVLTNLGNGLAKELKFVLPTTSFTTSSGNCGAELSAGQNCIFDVVFSPLSVGSFTSSLVVEYMSQSNPLNLTLNLTGNSFTPGAQDPAFGNSGNAFFPYTVSTSTQMHDVLYAMKQDASGKTIAVGTTYNNLSSPGHNDIAIVRTNTDGTLDTSFNSSGKNKIDFGFTDGARGVAIQQDGKILVGGFAYVSSKFRFAIMRFLSNGTLDTAYGTSGKTTTSFSSGAQALSMILSTSGKAILGGNAFNASKNSFALARYTASGSLDSTFGNSGKVSTTFSGSSFDTIQALVEDYSQNIIAAGYSTIAATNKLALAKYSSEGNLDTAFGSAGTLLPTFPGAEATATAITLDSSNNIYIAGRTTTSGNHNVLVMKFLGNGTIDNTFGTMGAIAVDLGSAQDQATGISLDSSGRVLVSAKGNTATLLRFLPNGQPDTSFGTNGRMDSTLGGTNAEAHCLLVESTGKIMIGGTASNGSNLDFALSRFLP